MASSVRIDGCLPGVDGSTIGLIFSRGFAVEFDWHNDRTMAVGQPKRLRDLRFPSPFDSDLEGVLRGRLRFSDFIYLFKNGEYLKLREATMSAEGEPRATAPAWNLPPDWTRFDAVVSGSGKKTNYCYFFRGDEYCRFDWAQDKISPGYPKKIVTNFHAPGLLSRDLDGIIVGQERFSTKAYLFKTARKSVDPDGNLVAAGTSGAREVAVPIYLRYDFDAESSEGFVENPLEVVTNWHGLFPLLDSGPATDLAIRWCEQTLGELNGSTPALPSALRNHFMTSSASTSQVDKIATVFRGIRERLSRIPIQFQWTPNLPFPAQTQPHVLTEIGDAFSYMHGPNGRAAVLIHESVHFINTGDAAVDVPEWSGETINGVAWPVDRLSGRAYHTISTNEALTNPSSFASFAQELAIPGDTRFGAARRHE